MNKNLFRNRRTLAPSTDTRNAAGGRAYSKGDANALAQFAVTGTFQDTFYVGAANQLAKVKELAQSVDAEFLAKLAVYSREHGKMKDMPAYLLATLAARGETELVKRIFPRVCNNSKVLFAFVRIIRSGEVGRKSFGTSLKRLIQQWITGRNNHALFMGTIGHSDPSMADVIKMVHPRPVGETQSNMFSYLLGNSYDLSMLPYDVRVFEQLKRGETREVPDIPFRAMTNIDLDVAQWRAIAVNMPWNTLRQNLNMLGRRGVFDDTGVVRTLADKLADEGNVVACNAFPFELLATWKATRNEVPVEISNALQEAMEVATRNVPKLQGDTLIAVDQSGSMCQGPVTGRGAKPSIIRVVEAASLIGCSLLRSNKTATLIGFDCAQWSGMRGGDMPGVYPMNHLNPFDSVMTNVSKMNAGGGGTDCSLPFQYLIKNNKRVDNIIVLSDYESWTSTWNGGVNCAPACAAWKTYSRKNPRAKLACVDLQPQNTNQVPDQPGRVINIGGWNDPMFRTLDEFFNRDSNVDFVGIIERAVDI